MDDASSNALPRTAGETRVGRIEINPQVIRMKCRDERHLPPRELRAMAGRAEPERGEEAGRRFGIDVEGAHRPPRPRGRRFGPKTGSVLGPDAQGNGLGDRRSLVHLRGEGEPQRRAVRLVGSVGPVALILGFENVTFETTARPTLPAAIWWEMPAQFHEGLVRGNHFRENGALLRPVGVAEHAAGTGARVRMQDAEADSIPQECRRALRRPSRT